MRQSLVSGFLALLGLLVPFTAISQAADTTAPAERRMARDTRYVVIHRPGPAWVKDKSPFEQPGMRDHVAHYRQLQQQGKLLLGGPFMDAASGGMMLPEAGLTEEEIKAFAAADPVVKSGVLVYEVRPWLIGMRK